MQKTAPVHIRTSVTARRPSNPSAVQTPRFKSNATSSQQKFLISIILFPKIHRSPPVSHERDKVEAKPDCMQTVIRRRFLVRFFRTQNRCARIERKRVSVQSGFASTARITGHTSMPFDPDNVRPFGAYLYAIRPRQCTPLWGIPLCHSAPTM